MRILCFFLSSHILCLFSVKAQIFPIVNEQTKVLAFPDEAGISLFFFDGKQAELFVLDQDLQLQSHHADIALPDDTRLEQLGFSNEASALHIYYEQDGEYQVLSVDKGSGLASRARINLSEGRSHLHAGAFTYEGILHIVRMSRGRNTLKICRFLSGGDFETREVSLAKPDFAAKANYRLWLVETDSPLELAQTYPAAKMYQREDRLILTLEEEEQTYVASLNLQDYQARESEVPAPLLDPTARHNSLLWQDHLIQFGISQDSLRLTISDIVSGRMLIDYAYGREDQMSLSGGPFVRQRHAQGSQSIPDLSAFLDECLNAPHLAIATVPRADETLNFAAGALRPERERGVSGIVVQERFITSWFETILDPYDWQAVQLIAGNSSPRWPRMQRKEPLETRFFYRGKWKTGYLRNGEYRFR